MSLQPQIDQVKEQHPSWKNNSRIIGRASELYCCEKIQCFKCNESNWIECDVNTKSKDQTCKKCGKEYQIKCKNTTEKSYKNIKKNGIFKTVGAEFNTTLKSIEDQIDYIIVLYEKSTYNIFDIIHVNSEDITRDNIIPRTPLSDKARRAGWQGCKLHFTKLNFMMTPLF